MKVLIACLSVFILISCSSNGTKHTWDGGAQKQEAQEQEARMETQDRIRNQFPGPSSF